MNQMTNLTRLSPKDVRRLSRNRKLVGTTISLCEGYVQANLVILPEKDAFDFLLFCERNPKPCPLLWVSSPGDPHPDGVAENADLRTDLIKYKVFRNGKLMGEIEDITDIWDSNLVAFLIGCSLSFDQILLQAGFHLYYRQGDQTRVYVYVSNIHCKSAGRFSSPMVVSMRPIPGDRVSEVVAITSRYPKVHGSPVYIGDPAGIGIDHETIIQMTKKYDIGIVNNLLPTLPNNITPVFWGCGITPQVAAIESKVEFMITHGSGTLFITDLKLEDLAVF